MKKLFIGLLVVAAGGAAFFLLNKKKNTAEVATINKELIIGKWKTDAVMANDSGFNKYSYSFQQGGIVLRSLSDSVKADTTHYEWNKANELVWKEKASDSVGTTYSVVKLTQDSLQVQSKDSVTFLFTKIK
jgi:hypothetical protein